MSYATLRLMPPAMKDAYLAELGRGYAVARLAMVHDVAVRDSREPHVAASPYSQRRADRIVNEIIGIEELISLATTPEEANADLEEHHTPGFRPEGTTRNIIGAVVGAELADDSIVIEIRDGADYVRVYGAPADIGNNDNVTALLEWRNDAWWAKEMSVNV